MKDKMNRPQLLGVGFVVAMYGLLLTAELPAFADDEKTSDTKSAFADSDLGAESGRTRMHAEGGRPSIPEDDLLFLMRYARRAMSATLRGKQPTTQPYCPSVLRTIEGRVYLTARRKGGVLVDAEAGASDLAEAAVQAGAAIGKKLLEENVQVRGGGDDIELELEMTGPSELIDVDYFGEGGTWTPALMAAFEPGVEGVEVRFADRVGRLRPSEIIESNYSPDLALVAAEHGAGVKQEFKARFADKIKYYRFWAFQVWQGDRRSKAIMLYRGEELVPIESVDEAGLDAAIARIGGYLHYRQNSNGAFSHEYLPSRDVYFDDNDAMVQLRALYGLQRYASRKLEPAVIADATKGIEAFSKYLEPLKYKFVKDGEEKLVEQPNTRILYIPGHENQFETTGYLALALSSHPNRELDTSSMLGMATTLVGAQLMDGSLRMKLGEAPSGETSAAEDRAAGVALFALAQHYEITKDVIIEQVFQNALPFYQDKIGKLDPEAAAWMIRAFAKQHDSTKNPQYLPIVFELADRFASVQLNKDNCPHAELWGAINAKQLGMVGADSAGSLAALADALAIAKRNGDEKRVETYSNAVRWAARFVMQLEMSKTGCYFVRSLRDAVGGIRISPWNVRLRADNTALAVDGLIAARTALFAQTRN